MPLTCKYITIYFLPLLINILFSQDCDENMYWTDCGLPFDCNSTCLNPDPPPDCITLCEIGCFCNEGYIFSNDSYTECILIEDCTQDPQIGDECILDDGGVGFLDCEQCCWDTGLLAWLGDGWCDDMGGCWFEGPQYDCPELGYDCGDCNDEWDGSTNSGLCEEESQAGDECLAGSGWNGYYDCNLQCFDYYYYLTLGDGWCAQGVTFWYGLDFNCPEFGFDCGDCIDGWDGNDPSGLCDDWDSQIGNYCEFPNGSPGILECTLDCADIYYYQNWLGDGYCDCGFPEPDLNCPEFNCDEGDCIDELCGDCEHIPSDCSLPGDVNEDGVINILDIIDVISYILHNTDASPHPCSDINEDGTIDILDIVIMVNMILGDD